MKIAVTATGPSLNDHVEPRFGRCPYFLIADADSMEFEAVENPNIAAGGGAGVQSAQLMADKGVETVLTGNCGPNAYNVFGAAGIQVIVGVSGVVHDAIKEFKAGAFTSTSGPNVTSHFGMGAGTPGGNPGMGGRGMGGGGGLGMGRGVGMGAGMTGVPHGTPYPSTSAIPQQPAARGTPALLAVVDADRCTSCGICVNACFFGAIVIKDVAEVDPLKCMGCGQCVAECPNEALSLVSAHGKTRSR
jgi:predicted Fe-Mo cluster-binding NifX family protein/Pyruvate/2-oxoacid:ferredoxin oxidoreductase delta subunit